MKQFAQLFQSLDQTTKINAKVAALAHYFSKVDDSDKLWTIALLSHRRPRRTINTRFIREWAAEKSGIPQWLFEESYHVVGDLAESIALLLPKALRQSDHSLSYWIQYIMDLKDADEVQKKKSITDAWDQLSSDEIFVFNKLITGGFRMGVSQKLMTRALAQHTKLDENVLARKLMGNWTPQDTTFQKLIFAENPADELSKPYPFYLAYALDVAIDTIGAPTEWQAEHKWDGIRGQLIRRGGVSFLWSRGEELITHSFPEIDEMAEVLPDGCVIDGEILPFKDGSIQSFQFLQKRLGRKKVSKNMRANYPCVLRSYDILEYQGHDLRAEPLAKRRDILRQLWSATDHPVFQFSEAVSFTDWTSLAEIQKGSRNVQSEGLMLKRLDSTYKVGRKKGEWWKWKVDPLVIDAVMIYAQRGHGRRANLFSDFTFAVWRGTELVPFAKAYSGLTDKEFNEITQFVRKNTLERFGPVRSVRPILVFELAFEGIQASSRHKSGVALRFPRINRWRKDKHPKDANDYTHLMAMLEQYG